MGSRDWVQGLSCRYEPLAFTEGMVRLTDIANALSNLCRYNGHTPTFYSVAEHSVLVAHRVKELGGDETAYAQALLHDASEAYMGDFVRPVKQLGMMKAFRDLDDQIQATIYRRWNLPETMLDIVAKADNQLLYNEACYFWGDKCVAEWSLTDREEIQWKHQIGWMPEEAKRMFETELREHILMRG